ncbi:MAG: leucine-rich repeat domain-containing protein [Bacteroidales bacterium]|nr:leucine-rich repeat domain-containing protein [Bacteroidales bacterium]
MKRIIFAICTILCANVLLAQTRFWIDDLQYEVTSTNPPKVKVYDAASSITIANIPATVTYNETIYSVTTIGNTAFFICSSLTSVSIPNSVTTIEYEEWGPGAFSECTSLTSVTFEEGINLTNIPPFTFPGCSSLTSIDIPNSVTSIGEYAFSGCSSLTSIDIPNSVTSIGESAFSGCSSLTSVTIPESVTSIGSGAFSDCCSLTTMNFNAINCNEGGELATCNNTYNEDGFQITYCPITTLNIGESVQKIPAYFARNSLITSITIPNSVTSIGKRAFEGCWSLTSVTIPNSVTSIGRAAFENCEYLTSVTLPENATIDTSAFYQSGYSTIDTVDNVVYCLSHEPLANIGNYTFERVFNVTFTIGDSIYAPNSATVWSHTPELSGDLVLTSYVYNGVSYPITSIDHGAFRDCSGLTSVIIPNSVKTIDTEAFISCTGLNTVTCFASIPPILGEPTSFGYSPFYNTPSNKILNVGCELRDDYAIVWTDFAPNNIYEIPFNVTVTANNDVFGSVTIVSECPTATLTATANDCYEFISWSDGNTDNPRTINLESDTALTAIFNGILNSSITATICQGEVYQEQGFNASEAGIYTQILEASNGCDSVVMLTLNVNPAFDTTINATINIGDVYSEYGFNETEDGTYVQNLQTINGCDSTITLNLTINTSLQDIAELTEITFHPNPTSGMITFSKEIERIDVIDNIGKVVMRFFDTNEINIETLPAGVYYLRMTIEDKTTTKKVIKK